VAHKGEEWNESETYRDAWTLRRVRRVTREGLYNQTPTYHTNVAFSADGQFLVFASSRNGQSAVFRCHVPTGDLQQLIAPVVGGGAEGLGISGTSLCLAPKSKWLVFVHERTVRAVHLETLEERVLIADLGVGVGCGAPSIDPTEQFVVLATYPQHPAIVAGNRPTSDIMEYFTTHEGVYLKLVQVPLAGGAPTVVYEEHGCRSAHAPHSPTDPDLLLLDRDFPPRFWGGSDGRTNRIWTLRLSTGQLTELPSQDAACFQVHSVWDWTGAHIYYHGRSAQGGYYIGVTTPTGEPVREYGFHDAPHYGHVSAMAGRPAIILDGNLSDHLLVWLSFDQPQPRIEVIARHGTNRGALPGQFPHPHPLADPTGRYISFNRGEKGRTDLYVVEV
jgi:hypothetical protein